MHHVPESMQFGLRNFSWQQNAGIPEDNQINTLMKMYVYFSREFSERMDMDLPFYYWTLNGRFSDEAYPSFDETIKQSANHFID